NISDFYTNTVDIVSKNKNLFLLIKPHPHENNPDISLTIEKYDDMKKVIKTSIPENAIFLNEKMFHNFNLLPFVDLNLFFYGTPGVEWSSIGGKALALHNQAINDYPIGFPNIKNREEYEYFLSNIDKIPFQKKFNDNAVLFIAYISMLGIDNKWTEIPDGNYGLPKINMKEISELVKTGNDDISGLLDSILNF
ncbi:MAG: hypothetical protein LBD41_02055, partial [Clostridiales Family XIII bacterium]|nr:hypothetical protein [Clostridiales Family XIII bacterium]